MVSLLCCSVVFVVLGALDVVDGQNKFTYTIHNQLMEPFFTHSVDLQITGNENLFFYMGKAVNESVDITGFSVTYFANLGYAIDSINDVYDTWITNDILYFWSISNQDGRFQVGVSTYRPRKDDEVLHNYTVYTRNSPHS